MYLIVHGEGLAKANNQHGGVLLVDRGVVKVDVVHQLDRLGVVHGRPFQKMVMMTTMMMVMMLITCP